MVELLVLDLATCRVCGCTDDRACEGGCWWVSGSVDADLCSRCFERLEDLVGRLAKLDADAIGIPMHGDEALHELKGLVTEARELAVAPLAPRAVVSRLSAASGEG